MRRAVGLYSVLKCQGLDHARRSAEGFRCVYRHSDAGIVVGDDLLPVAAVLCHLLRAVLAHSHAVAIPGYKKDDFPILNLRFKGGGAQGEDGPHLRPPDADAAHGDGVYVAVLADLPLTNPAVRGTGQVRLRMRRQKQLLEFLRRELRPAVIIGDIRALGAGDTLEIGQVAGPHLPGTFRLL